MTTTTATAKATTIPATGLRFETAAVTVTAMYVNGAGYKVQVRINGAHRPELGGLYTFEDGANGALNAYNTLVEQYEAETPAEVEPTAPVVKLPAAAKGTVTKVSDPGHTVLAICSLNPAGRIDRGGQPGQADVRLLTSLAKRHLVRLTYQEGRSDARKVVTGAVITNGGRAALDRLTAEDRAAAEMAAKLAVIDTIRIAA